MALVLLGAEDEGQRWQLRFSWARLPGVPGVQVLRAFYGQEILLALFWDRCGSPPHDLFPAALYGASPRPGAPPQTLGPGRGPPPSRSLPGAAARVEPSDPSLMLLPRHHVTVLPPSTAGPSQGPEPLVCEGSSMPTWSGNALTSVWAQCQTGMCDAFGRLWPPCAEGRGPTVHGQTAARGQGQRGRTGRTSGQTGLQEARPGFLPAVWGYSEVPRGNPTSLPLRTAKLAPEGAACQAV